MKSKPGDSQSQHQHNEARRWLWVIVAICAVWLSAMVAASYYGLEYKTPVRIKNWQPEPPERH